MAAKTYTLGGFEVYDVNGVPHYTSTKTKVKIDKTGKPISPFYTLNGVEVYDKDGVPHYRATGQRLQQGTDGTPQAPDAGDAMDGGGSLPEDQPSADTRTSPTGLVQKGMTLGGVKDYILGTGINLQNAGDYFNLSGQKEGSYGSKVTGPNGETWELEDHVFDNDTGGLVPPSTPGVTGKSGQNPQSGVSKTPDQADNLRALSLTDGEEPFGGTYGDDDQYVSPMYADKARNQWRAAFLNSRAKGPAALMREADASIGVIRDNKGNIAFRNGENVSTYTGDADSRDVIYDIRGGQKGMDKHISGFTPLNAASVPDSPEVAPDDEQTPATIEPTVFKPGKPDGQRSASQAFKDNYVKGVSKTVPTSKQPSSDASDEEWNKYFTELEGGNLTGS